MQTDGRRGKLLFSLLFAVSIGQRTKVVHATLVRQPAAGCNEQVGAGLTLIGNCQSLRKEAFEWPAGGIAACQVSLSLTIDGRPLITIPKLVGESLFVLVAAKAIEPKVVCFSNKTH